ncbi:MAG: MCD, Malonyl-CoA decarboxylase MCD [Alphaproteobacteria bacterium]|nr:MCD, Malonyl-CoA decarboxylase MCD [Alphaproteobacteria bacterium]
MVTSYFGDLIETIVSRGHNLLSFAREFGGRAPARTDLVELAEALLSRRGEASGVVLASAILAALRDADATARDEFLRALATRFGADAQRLRAAVETWTARGDPASETALHLAAEPRRQELFRRLNLAPGGTAALVALRGALLDLKGDDPALAAVDADFAHLFASWFNRGFLVLRRIDWMTPANILEKIIAYEAVHEIRDWNDLRNRLEPPDRRCFAFFHPQLVDEPLVFVEIALMPHVPSAIGPLLDAGRAPIAANEATTAVFYSISNCQQGLRGISFGNFLIKQVVEELKRELPSLETFVTLSPLPGFASWLTSAAAGPASEDSAVAASAVGGKELQDEDVVLHLAAQYLLQAKTTAGKPLDPVARFHLGNGASLHRINADADLSAKGRRQSHGVMVNYLYDVESIETNHEAFAEKGEVVADAAIHKLLRTMSRRARARPAA